MHSDDEPLFSGYNVVIVSLSLGASRIFNISKNSTGKTRGLALPSGSLLVMHGLMQNHYKHGVPAGVGDDEPRFNLTWRFIINHSCSLSGTGISSGEE